MPARYHLRFQLPPRKDPAEAVAHATALARACQEAGVDEVVLLLAAEEVFDGYLTGEAEDRWYETTATVSDVLRDAGLDVSLNPWVTTGHADRGRKDAHGFLPMVSPTGRTAAAQASFTCPDWREWLYAHYGRFAGLGFRVLWLEDDFRFHNHAPLDWGGGFEAPVLNRLADLAGRPVTRDEVVRAITEPGPPHPWRALLQQVWRTVQTEIAERLSEVVEEISSGRSRLGLMSSLPDVHSVEGRDWPALFQALAVQGRATHRPHFAPYSDSAPRSISGQMWLLESQRALRPAWVESEPEIENWPHTTWSKSDVQTWSEMTTAQLSGADALFLNVHPMQAGRPDRFRGTSQLLRRSRPALDWIAGRHTKEARTLGVGLPYRQDAAAHVRTRTGTLDELRTGPRGAADFLLRYGIPVTASKAPVQAVFGKLAWAFDDGEIREMLTGGLLLDGVAADVLTRRGFGDLLGVQVTEVVDREDAQAADPFSFEQITHHPDPDIVGTLLSVNTQPALARLRPGPEAVVWTHVLTPGEDVWGAGSCGYVNELGGRVAVLAATDPADLPRDDFGQRVIHAVVRFLEGQSPTLPLVSGGPHLIPHLSQQDGVTRLAMANGSFDPALPHVDIPTPPDAVSSIRLDPLKTPAPASVLHGEEGITAETELPHRAWLMLAW
ncbi:hypothetical protein [Streptomyces sp. NBC_00063]|uniref:hypothetical protein n=1 Tax=Streptomyces sp. NBC_00063 TaxID=2975638 RepID=UPI0022562D99|nr:hypothetical protein [Streptomyces sp. NBC_00063]MCX5442211.1 hypothetical protein [Streptomyces sp. NBC_00063]